MEFRQKIVPLILGHQFYRIEVIVIHLIFIDLKNLVDQYKNFELKKTMAYFELNMIDD